MTALEAIQEVFKTFLWTIFNFAIEIIKNETMQKFLIVFTIIIITAFFLALILRKINKKIFR